MKFKKRMREYLKKRKTRDWEIEQYQELLTWYPIHEPVKEKIEPERPRQVRPPSSLHIHLWIDNDENPRDKITESKRWIGYYIPYFF